MDDFKLQKLHSLQLKIAKEILRICEKNSIDYSLSGGTLIGAVRHSGFIPWDDDMDIDMTRENYLKFIKACEHDLGKEFYLENWYTDNKYWNGFSKIMLKDTILVEDSTKFSNNRSGIYVDIFPWDNAPNNIFQRLIHEKKVRFNVLLLIAKHNIQIPSNSSHFKKSLYVLLKKVTQKVDTRKLIEHYEKDVQRYNTRETHYITCAVGVQGYKKNLCPREWFNSYIKLNFEDTEFSAIQEYDKLLSQSYGDYMQLPPLEKRRTHNIDKLDFGPYLEL